MAGSYDGSIHIDTAINAAPIDNGLAQIENKIKGLAATIGLAFGVKELIDFGKRSIDAASDLAEAQNVVDTAFGAMSWKMEQFAATALETYGIKKANGATVRIRDDGYFEVRGQKYGDGYFWWSTHNGLHCGSGGIDSFSVNPQAGTIYLNNQLVFKTTS